MKQEPLFDKRTEHARWTEREPRAHARRSDPETSHQAAASVKRMRESQMFILGLFRRHGGMVDDELIVVASGVLAGRKMSVSGIRTRRSELVRLGMVRDTGKRRRLESGRLSIVWAAV